ncbi:MAG: Na+/H+ antiporter subunit E [Herbiconiux sp.]|uniref:Na+/H+ antiporter subunit E n=1 Tax=Herbiconiux sp. TaxID=1871186 RepID=UPI0012010249|nr:Na+/H+ antiporter subunit E [Herbiconiux sp.]TAJ48548.1 MAG: Na+/H+ antiporter subunit E [Herbiconiux sp.]
MRARIASGLVPFLGLVLLWMLLWGEFSLINLIIGMVLALLVSAVFYLPAVRLSGRLNPWRALLFLVRLVWDIVVASLQIAWVAIGPRRHPLTNAIFAVTLRTRSDLVMTFTAEAVSLVPGSIVLDLDREEGILYLHAFNVLSLDDLPGLRREVLATERRLILAAGSLDDLQRLRDAESDGGTSGSSSASAASAAPAGGEGSAS